MGCYRPHLPLLLVANRRLLPPKDGFSRHCRNIPTGFWQRCFALSIWRKLQCLTGDGINWRYPAHWFQSCWLWKPPRRPSSCRSRPPCVWTRDRVCGTLGWWVVCKSLPNARFGVEVRSQVNHLISHIVLRAAYPKGDGFMKSVEFFKVNIRLVHHVEGKRLWFMEIQFIAVVPFSVNDLDVCGDVAT